MSEEAIVNSGEVPEEAEGFSEKEKAANRPGTEKADSGTEKADSGTEKADSGTEKPETETRDWVGEAVQCFIKDASGIDPTDPVKAVEAYFQRNATDELKARCKTLGKDAKGCWKFIEAVARKALHGSSGHIDPSAIYAIAMHYFEDVPKDWDKKKAAQARPSGRGKSATPKKQQADNSKAAKPKKPAETPSEIRKEKTKAAKAKAKPKAKKPKQQQGFFFEMLETPTVGGEEGQESEVQG